MRSGLVGVWSGLVRFVRVWSMLVGFGRGCSAVFGVGRGVGYLVRADSGWSGLFGFVQVWSVLFGVVGAAGYLVGADSGWSGLFGFGQVCSAVFGGGRLLRGGWRRALAGRLFCCGGATVSRSGVGWGVALWRRVVPGSLVNWCWQAVRDGGAANRVGFGPPIKSGATDPGAARLGAVHGEIPLFGPGAGSAASAGMTESWGGGDGGARGDGGVGAEMAEGSRDDGEVRCGGGAVLGEIPAASAGMTEWGARV